MEHADEQRGRLQIIVPQDLARTLGDALRHFAAGSEAEVVVERREGDRRRAGDRRRRRAPVAPDRRRVRGEAGRRAGERRAPVIPVVGSLLLPRRARRHADRLTLVERVPVSAPQREDLEDVRDVLRAQAGELGAFAALHHRWFDRMHAYLQLTQPESERAIDEVFFRAFSGLAELCPSRTSFRAWLFAHAEPGGLPELSARREELRVVTAGVGAVPGGEDEVAALRWLSDGDLVDLLRLVSPVQRRILLLRHLVDLTVPETAAALQLPAPAVRSLQDAGLAALRTRIRRLGAPRESHVRRMPMRATAGPRTVLRARRAALLLR